VNAQVIADYALDLTLTLELSLIIALRADRFAVLADRPTYQVGLLFGLALKLCGGFLQPLWHFSTSRLPVSGLPALVNITVMD